MKVIALWHEPVFDVAGVEGDETRLGAQLADVDRALALAADDDRELDHPVADAKFRLLRHAGSSRLRGWVGKDRHRGSRRF